MALREDMERSGNWLFQRRSYLPLVPIVLLLASLKDYQYLGHSKSLATWWTLLCMAICFLGLGIRVVTIGYAPLGTSGRNVDAQKADTLNTVGIYSLVRHPLYLGNSLVWLGVTLFVHSWQLTLICLLTLCVYYERIMFAEEEYLRRKFGSAYEEWARLTPAVLPRFSGWRSPGLTFSLRHVLRREYGSLFTIILMFTLLETLGDLVVEGRFSLSEGWLIVFLSGLAVYLTLRFLKKKTHLLSVQGR